MYLGTPVLPDYLSDSSDRRLFPKECIERHCSYTANLSAKVVWTVNDKAYGPVSVNLGEIPIMVMVGVHYSQLKYI